MALAAAWLLPGLIGHDPWKQDEPYILGIIQHMLTSGDWIVPSNAGIPFMEKPPLYYWTGAVLAAITSSLLPLHDGARLASGFFSALTLLFVGLGGREAWGPSHGRLAVLALLASFGLLYESHIMITDVPMLTGYAIASYGFLLALRKPLVGGFWLGTGAGVGLLAKGLLVPGSLGVTGLLLLLFAPWRTRRYGLALIVALLAVLPWLLIWPVALWLRSPELFYQWFWVNNFGRFLGFSVPQLGAGSTQWFWPRTLPWFAWPVLPLALLTLWQKRAQLLQQPALQYGLLGFVVCLAVLQVSASARTAYGLPMLVGLTLLATPSVIELPANINRWGDWFARLLFLPAVLLSWLVWGMMMATGKPPHWHWLDHGLAPDFVMPFLPLPVLAAFFGTLIWLFSWRHLPQLRERAVLSGALGITVFWLLFSTLWLPWVDNAKRFREVFNTVAQQLPENYHCISGINLGESTRPMFDYYLGLSHIRFTHGENAHCRAMLIDQPGQQAPKTAPHWQAVWNGSRPQDDEERFWLYIMATTRPESDSGILPH